MKKDLNLIEQKENKKSKGIKNLVVCAGTFVILCGNTVAGIAIYDANFVHTEEICPLTSVLGVEHQVSKINETGRFEALYNEEKVYVIQHMFQDGTTMEPHQVIEGDHVVTEYREIPVYETEYIQKHYSADNNEILVVNLDLMYTLHKKLKVK